MAKILLVEDDNNLREIYEARLQAEGYDIVSARDGEEALSVAMKEKPDLIISDVMMPKISGFDMLDILRTTEETKNAKVIMMTALSQAEDKIRAEKLGADRYLVKSQVTLEDVAKTAKEVLEGKPAPAEESKPEVSEAPNPEPKTDDANSNSSEIVNPEAESAQKPAEETKEQDSIDQTIEEEEKAIAEQIQGNLNNTPQEEQPAPVKVEQNVVPAPKPEAPATNTKKPTSETPPQTPPAEAPVATVETAAAAPQPTVPESNTAPAQTPEAPETPIAPPAEPEAKPPAEIPTPKTETTPAPSAESTTAPPQAPDANAGQTTENKQEDSPKTAVPPQKKKVIQPINDLKADTGEKLNELLTKEQEKEAMAEVARNAMQQPGSTTPAPSQPAPQAQPTPQQQQTPVQNSPAPGQTVSGPDTPIDPPQPNTKIDPNSIAL